MSASSSPSAFSFLSLPSRCAVATLGVTQLVGLVLLLTGGNRHVLVVSMSVLATLASAWLVIAMVRDRALLRGDGVLRNSFLRPAVLNGERRLSMLSNAEPTLRNLSADGNADAAVDAAADADAVRAAAETASRRLAAVWADIVEAGRVDMETAIVAVTDRFSRIVSGLDAAIRAAKASSHSDAIDTVAQQAYEQLAHLMEDLRASCVRERAMRDDVEALAARIETLRQGADAVRTVARRATLLSLNAAIEAARAGDRGNGFAVVAAEMQRLSLASGALGEDMATTSTDTISAISAAVQAVRESVALTERMVESAEQRVTRVLDEYAGLTDHITASTASLSEVASDVNASVSEAIVSLQFQDRTSQMLAHVRDSVRRSPTTVFKAGALPDAQAELDALAKSYATAEERAIHVGRKPGEERAGDITFF